MLVVGNKFALGSFTFIEEKYVVAGFVLSLFRVHSSNITANPFFFFHVSGDGALQFLPRAPIPRVFFLSKVLRVCAARRCAARADCLCSPFLYKCHCLTLECTCVLRYCSSLYPRLLSPRIYPPNRIPGFLWF